MNVLMLKLPVTNIRQNIKNCDNFFFFYGGTYFKCLKNGKKLPLTHCYPIYLESIYKNL